MKKRNWLLATVAVALLAGGLPQTVLADGPGTREDNLNTTVTAGYVVTGTEPGVGGSVAEFELMPGTLALTQVPNLHFESLKVSDLIKGEETIDLVDGVTTGENAFDGNAEKAIEVTDFRGTNAGWTLNGNLGAFNAKQVGTTISATKLSFTGVGIGGDNPGTMAISADTNTVGGDKELLRAGTDGTGAGTTTATVNTAALTLPQTTAPKADTYSATMTWTLAAIPVTP